MKVFGKHNTEMKGATSLLRICKITIDKNNNTFCVNKSLFSKMDINPGDKALVLFIEDNEGVLGICRTDDKKIGIPIFWYKGDTRCRIFNNTMLKYVLKKHNISIKENSIHLIFKDEPVVIDNRKVFQISEVLNFQRQKIAY